MDIHQLRGVMTAIMLLTFLGIIVWTFVGRRDRFSEAAELPFADEDPPASRRADTAAGMRDSEEHPN